MPRKDKVLSKVQMAELKADFAKYIEDTPDPTIATYCTVSPVAKKYWVTKENMYSWKALDPLTKRATTKQEAWLLEQGNNGKNVIMAIFRLKQPVHGYRDKFEQDITSHGEKITFTNAVPRPGKEDKQKKH